MHAALGDETRLRIVDHLAYGDASLSELASALGAASNLLAHHVGVLENAGLVARKRSEGDRRRSYVHLEADRLHRLLTLDPRPVHRILFVCTANSARSQLAAALWSQASTLPVASAGTHPAPAIAAGAAAAARRHGLKLVDSRPALLSDVARPNDLIVTVCDHAHEELGSPGASIRSSRLHWSIPDPVPAGTAAAFDGAFDDLAQRIAQLAPRLSVA